MTIDDPDLLDSLYEQFTALAGQVDHGGSPTAFGHGRRAALARARLFVLDQQAAEATVTLGNPKNRTSRTTKSRKHT